MRRSNPFFVGIASLALAMTLAGCEGYKTPGFSNDPAKMSGDTLCYRYAYAKSGPEMKKEVDARGLDCREVLEQQAPVGESRW